MPFQRGIKNRNYNYHDAEYSYVKKKLYLDFFHVPSGKSVQFKAMLTQFSDAYESNWNEEQVYARNDTIGTFQGTRRTITLGWDVVAASAEEAKENLQRVTLLLAMLYPTYEESKEKGVSFISAAPLFKLQFSNLIQNRQASSRGSRDNNNFSIETIEKAGGEAKYSGLVGKISGLTYAPVIEYGYFDTPDGNLYPQTVNLSCTFTVVHTHPLGWGRNKEFRAKNFPYGLPIREVGGSTEKDVKKSSKLGGTDSHKTAMLKKITEF